MGGQGTGQNKASKMLTTNDTQGHKHSLSTAQIGKFQYTFNYNLKEQKQFTKTLHTSMAVHFTSFLTRETEMLRYQLGPALLAKGFDVTMLSCDRAWEADTLAYD